MTNWTEISSAALAANFRAVQAAAGEATEVLAVIKADAYGHGASLCAPVLTAAGARWLGVTDAEEGVRVRQALGETATRILVMRGSQPDDAAAIVAHDLTPVIWNEDHLDTLEAAASAAGLRLAVHVELDTGMARQGVLSSEEVQALFARLAKSQWLHCEGILSHLCCSEVAEARTTREAMERFAALLNTAESAGLTPSFLHIGNTSAVDEATTTRWIRDQAVARNARAMVRTGLAVYGYTLPIEGDALPRLNPAVAPVLTWYARVIDTFSVDKGIPVGYGATFTATAPMRLALLAVGYADGFRREASSGLGDGWVMFHGQRAPIVGRVSMNLTVVDVTQTEAVKVGDAAVLLGEGVTAEDHARWAQTIPYEIICAVRGARRLV